DCISGFFMGATETHVNAAMVSQCFSVAPFSEAIYIRLYKVAQYGIAR
ncbi:hypothetical protein VII00023_19189, partial [Vibrio ichthyoenteri ATCC 700023]